MAWPNVPLIDNATRANESPLAAPWGLIDGVVGLKIDSNTIKPIEVGGGNGMLWTLPLSANMEIAAKIAQAPTDGAYGANLIVRSTSPTSLGGNRYELDMLAVAAGNDKLELWKLQASVFTLLTTYTLGANFAVGDTFGLQVIGAMLTSYYNGVVLGTFNDTSILTGSYAALYMSVAATPAWVNSVWAGAVAGSRPAAYRPAVFAPGIAR
jgi:hypothetical protein